MPILPLYINKINEVITNTTVADVTPIADVTLLTNQDGSPRQSPPSEEFGVDAKELLFKITGTPGVASDPTNLGIILGGQPVKSNLNVKVSENDFRTQAIEVFPLGLLDIEIMEENLKIKPADQDDKYTATFIACGVESEDVYKLYQANQLSNGNVRGNEFKKLIENQALISDKISKTREIYFEPIGEDCVKTHFGIDAADGASATDIQEDILKEEDTIELINDNGDVEARLSDLELSTERRFTVEVTTDLPPGQIKTLLENEPNSPEFEQIDSIREEDGKTVFDFVTDRNLNIGPANFPALEDKIDGILGSDDAKIRVPGADLIPLRQYIGTVRIPTDEETTAPLLEDYKTPSDLVLDLNLPSQWVIDYKAAVELDVIEAYIAADISFGVRKADIIEEVNQLLDGDNTFSLNTPRAFRGKCQMLDQIEPELLNKTIHEFVIGLNQNLKTSAIYQGSEAIYTFGSRRRRQTEDLEVKFYFQSLEPERLIPAQLEGQGKRIIDQNPSFATLYDSSTLEITPQMFEEDIIPVTLPTDPPTTEPSTTTEVTTESTKIDIVTEDGREASKPPATAPTLPTTVSRNAVAVYNCTEEPTEDPTEKLETTIEASCPSAQDIDCSNTVVRESGAFVVQCKYTIKADKDQRIEDVERSMDNCLPKEVDCLKQDTFYIDDPTFNKCLDPFENSCDPEVSVCDFKDGELTCKCVEGYEKEDENDIKSACVPSGPDVVLIILIVLIIILFLVILLLSYFVHQKRTKTGMYSPSKHQPTQIQS